MGNANSFSFADVECAFSGSLVLGSWFYTYCTLLMVMPALMAGILVCFYTMIWFCQHGCSKRQASEAKRHDDETGLEMGVMASTGSLSQRSSPSSAASLPSSQVSANILHVPVVEMLHPPSLRSQLVNICIITVYLMWSWCALTVLQVMFDCVDKGDGKRRLAFDLSQICYTNGGRSNHSTFVFSVALPGFLLYVVGAPVTVGIILFRVRHQLGDSQVLARYGFLLAGYRRERYYWEMVIMARRFCVILAAVALDSLLLLQLAVSSLICLIFLVLHVKLKPYATDEATLLSRLNMAMSEHLAISEKRATQFLATAIKAARNRNARGESKVSSRPSEATQRSQVQARSTRRTTRRIQHRHHRNHSAGILSLHARELALQGPEELSVTASSALSRVSGSQSTMSLPRATARTVVEYGKRVSRVEMFALATNYVTFYLALFIAGPAGRSVWWANVVGVLLIGANVSFIVYFSVEYRHTFVAKVRKEQRNAKKLMCAVKSRATHVWKHLKRAKPPVHSTASIRVDQGVVEMLNALHRTESAKSLAVAMETADGSGRGCDEQTSVDDKDIQAAPVEVEDLVGQRQLPAGWEEYLDSNSGFFFWVGPAGEATWEPPEGMVGDDPNPTVQDRKSAIESMDPSEWEYVNDMHNTQGAGSESTGGSL